jgi:hypothetical protein
VSPGRWGRLAASLGLALGLSVASVGSGASPGAAQDRSLTGHEAAALARQAESSDAALASLRRVRSVDGQRVDLRSATAVLGSRADRRARLEQLARQLDSSARTAPGRSSRAERARAEEVLRGRDYQDHSVPRPFRRILRWLGDQLQPLAPVGRAIVKVVGWVGDALTFSPLLTLAVLVAAVAGLATYLIGRRSKAHVGGAAGASWLADPEADPAELDRQAEAAERAGDFTAAVRLRYEAGAIRLARAGRVELRRETTASAIADQVGGDAVRRLTTTFEEVVYGGRPATPSDCAAAASGWAAVQSARPAEVG